MIILKTSSKTLDETPYVPDTFTLPLLLETTKKLTKEYRQLSEQELAKKMHMSLKLAFLNHERFAKMSFPLTPQNAKPALFTFKGDVYRDITPETYTQQQIDYAQNNLRILSGLYGILRPLDLIQPYRLEMALTWKDWQQEVTTHINNMKGPIINLASAEYMKALGKTKHTIIKPVFKQDKQGKITFITIFSKYARGTLADWLIQNQIKDPEKIKEFSEDGYKYNNELSTKEQWVFVRKA